MYIKAIDRVGQRFGRLVATNVEARRDKYGRTLMSCHCDCGADIIVQTGNLASGNTTSCGCINRELFTKHGQYNSPTYGSWSHMLSRCRDPSNTRYADYGGRGITVCAEWADFVTFLTDMGPRPDGCSIDRINNSLGYSKDNCRWATIFEQARNTRRTVLDIDTASLIKTMLLHGCSTFEIAQLLGVSKHSTHNIKYGNNWANVAPMPI